MKRLFIAAALLIAVAAACIWSLKALDNGTAALLLSLREMEAAVEQGDTARAQALADEFPAQFRRKTRQFPFFMQHEDVTDIEEIVTTLPILLKTGDTAHFAAELTRCRTQLENLRASERPIPENIL